MKIESLLEDRVLVRPDNEVDRTRGGILLPQRSVERPLRGTILAVGPGKRRPSGPIIFYYEMGNPKSFEEVSSACQRAREDCPGVQFVLSPTTDRDKVGASFGTAFLPMTLKVGDRVMYTMFSGGEVEVEGYDRKLLMMKESEVLCTIVDESSDNTGVPQ